MILREIEALLTLSIESRNVKQLAEAIGCTYVRASQIVRQLLQKGFATKTNGLISLANTAHAILFRKISTRYDVSKLLSDSKEDVALALLNAGDIRGIQEETGVTYWTVRRSLNKMMETGAISEKEGRYFLADDQDLRLFLRLWAEEKHRRLVEPYAEVVYASSDIILKRLPEGKPAKGSSTAFSAFGKYGVELRTVYSHYAQPERPLSAEDVLAHAIVFSKKPVELTDCAVFYAKNRDSLDLSRLREAAKRFHVDDIVIDIENYVRNLTVPSPERFLPWDEFAEKARLYGISAEGLLPPPAFPELTDELAKSAKGSVTLYMFGGEAMRIRGLKRATKDVDLVVKEAEEFVSLRNALTSMGYRPLGEDEISEADRKLDPSGIFVKNGYPRVDLFVRRICNAFLLSDSMRKRCEAKERGNLALCILSNEDVFLLKSITDREGDLYDMIELAKTRGFDWRIVLDELHNQEGITGRHFCRHLLDAVEFIQKRAGMRAPIYNELENHCIDQAILESVGRWSARSFKEIRELARYPDYRLRSRIQKLLREGELALSDDGKYATSSRSTA